MIRRLDAALRSDLAAAPVDRGLALFEAAMMTRCAALPSDYAGRGRAGGQHERVLASTGDWRDPGVLVELGSKAAAQRYRSALAGLTADVDVRARQLGWRHQYEVYQVIVPPRDEPKVVNRLRRAWQSGSALLEGSAQLTQSMRRRTAARAAWRAALLVAGPGRGIGCVRARLADSSAVDVLALSSSTLGIPARILRRPGGYIVTVEGEAAMTRLLGEVGSGLPETPPAALIPAV